MRSNTKRLSYLKNRLRSFLGRVGVETPELDVDLILQQVLRADRATLLASPDREVSEEEYHEIKECVVRRAKRREPISQILGFSPFYGQNILVNSGCLTPRPETESLVEKILEEFTDKELLFADWCTGSACIAIALLMFRAKWRGIAIDLSPRALEVAWKNSKIHNLQSRLLLWHSGERDYQPIDPGTLDFIVCNPPYIPTGMLSTLMPEVRHHEPHLALDGGVEGVDFFKMFLPAFRLYLKIGGRLYLETDGPDQIALLSLYKVQGLRYESTFEDCFGVDRFMIWQRIA